jgi:hypothetical protein
MKRLACLVLLVFTALAAHADNWLVNGDFSNAADHWYGDAKWPSDFAAPDPFTKADPFTSQGMIFQLKNDRWLKECQDFKGRSANGILKISYVLSPGLTFSTNADDYKSMPSKIGWVAFKPLDSPPTDWVVFVSELAQRHGLYRVIAPQMGSTQEQTISVPLEDMTPWSPKTIAIAFPPGNGTVVIHSVQIVDP